MKKIVYVVSCIILVVFMTHALGHLVRPVDTDIALNSIRTFYDIPKDSVEVMVYGSSIAWRGLDVMEMYEKQGIGAYNLGCNWQHINTTSLFMKESLKYQTPKVVLIETYGINQLLQNTDINGEIYYTRALHESEEKREYLTNVFGGGNKQRFLSYYMPLYAFHENWSKIDSRNFQKDSSGYDFKATMGYLYTEGITEVTLGNANEFAQGELSSSCKKVLDDIVELCKEKQIEVVFFTLPMTMEFMYSDAMHSYAEESGCTYINLYDDLEKIGIDGKTDFCDKNHLNNKGAKKVGAYFAQYLSDNYQLTDMRKVEGNMWEQELYK